MFTFRNFFGDALYRNLTNYLGIRKGNIAITAVYVISFFYIMHRMDITQRLNISRMVNPRDFNGEIMMKLILKNFP